MNKEPLDELQKRSQVSKKKINISQKYLFIAGLIIICLILGISGFSPKKTPHAETLREEKIDNDATLKRNMELIAKFRENHEKIRALRADIVPIINNDDLNKETLARMNAPSTFFNIGEATKTGQIKASSSKALIGNDINSQFLNQQNDITTATAKQLPHPAFTIPAGEMMPATLETAINSELAGMARAIITRDIYSLSNKLLIPKGATLVGQFNSAVTQGQSRIFVVWDRVQIPNGVIVTLNSPSTDAIGRAGSAADYIDRHFFERFGSGVLLSVLGAYTSLSGVNGHDEYNSASQYRMNIASSFQQASNQTMQNDMQTKPTLQINQGSTINVFVAHDLDFYHVRSQI